MAARRNGEDPDPRVGQARFFTIEASHMQKIK